MLELEIGVIHLIYNPIIGNADKRAAPGSRADITVQRMALNTRSRDSGVRLRWTSQALYHEKASHHSGIQSGPRTQDADVPDVPSQVSQRVGRRADLQKVQGDSRVAQRHVKRCACRRRPVSSRLIFAFRPVGYSQPQPVAV